MIDEERIVRWMVCGREGVEGVMCGREGVERVMGGREEMKLSLVDSISVHNA